MSFRLVDEVAVLVVDRKPRDVYRTVTYGHLELAVPHTLAVGEHLHFAVATTRRLFLRTDTRQDRSNEAVVQAGQNEKIILTHNPNLIPSSSSLLQGYFVGCMVERWSLTGELFLSCARFAANR